MLSCCGVALAPVAALATKGVGVSGISASSNVAIAVPTLTVIDSTQRYNRLTGTLPCSGLTRARDTSAAVRLALLSSMKVLSPYLSVLPMTNNSEHGGIWTGSTKQTPHLPRGGRQSGM